MAASAGRYGPIFEPLGSSFLFGVAQHTWLGEKMKTQQWVKFQAVADMALIIHKLAESISHAYLGRNDMTLEQITTARENLAVLLHTFRSDYE